MTSHRIMRLAMFVPWLGAWLLYREHKRAVARMERLLRDINDIRFLRMEVRDSEILMEMLRDAEARTLALEAQRDSLVATLDALYAAEIKRCAEPTG